MLSTCLFRGCPEFGIFKAIPSCLRKVLLLILKVSYFKGTVGNMGNMAAGGAGGGMDVQQMLAAAQAGQGMGSGGGGGGSAKKEKKGKGKGKA